MQGLLWTVVPLGFFAAIGVLGCFFDVFDLLLIGTLALRDVASSSMAKHRNQRDDWRKDHIDFVEQLKRLRQVQRSLRAALLTAKCNEEAEAADVETT